MRLESLALPDSEADGRKPNKKRSFTLLEDEEEEDEEFEEEEEVEENEEEEGMRKQTESMTRI